VKNQSIRVVGLVAHQNNRLVRQVADRFRNGNVRKRRALQRIVEPREPDSPRRALQRRVAVPEHRDAVRGKRLRDLFRIDHEVVVAQDRVTLPASEFVEEAGALPSGADGEFLRRKLAGDKVAGDDHCIGVEAIDAVYDITDKERLRELVHVNVADLRNAEAVERLRQSRKEDVARRDVDPMARDFA